VFRIYLLFSVVLFWVAVGWVEKRFAYTWILNALVSIFYLPVIAMLARWITTPDFLTLFPRRLYPSTKLALFFNYLTLVLGVQIFIGTWWHRACIILGLFAVTFASLILLKNAAPYFVNNLKAFFFPPPDDPSPPFDPSDPQGRRIR